VSRFHPDAAPMQQPNLAGLAPAVIATAEHDVLRDDGELYAARLLYYGVPVEHRRFDGQIHGFFTMIGILPGSGPPMDFVVEQVAAALDAAPVLPVA
jgi:acetyl esterase